MKQNVKGIVKNGISVICIVAALIFFVLGRRWSEKGEPYVKNLTIQENGQGIDGSWLRSAMQEEGVENEEQSEQPKYTFAAWKQLRKEAVTTELGSKYSNVDVLAVYGSSHCIFPIGKNLSVEDPGGCIIGKKLVEELFGGTQAEGSTIRWREREWVVRGVVEEPSDLLMVQASDMGDEISFDRINLVVKKGEDKRQMEEEFVGSTGLSAHALRWDYLYGLNWLQEMIPGKWSDFAGWGKNFETYRVAVSAAKKAERTSVEELGLAYKKKGERFAVVGILFGIVGVGCLFLRVTIHSHSALTCAKPASEP